MRLSRFIVTMLSVGFLASPFAIYADDLKISNDTGYDLSFAFNQVCASQFGYVPARTIESRDEALFLKACQNNCEVKIYDQKNCQGEVIESLIYDLPNKRVEMNSTGAHQISTGVSGLYNLFFSEPIQK